MQKPAKPRCEESNRDLTNPLKVVAGSTAANSDQSRNVPPSKLRTAAGSQQGSSAVAHRATGPRTSEGKNRSRRNAFKTGIFSKDLLVSDESRAEYQSLLNGFRDALQPQGTLETMLVENLAVITWRKRRLMQAEHAEIEKATQFNFLDSVQAQRAEAWDRSRAGETSGGMLRPSSNPLLIRDAVSMLKIFRGKLEAVGFHKDDDPWILRKLYGLDHDAGIPFCLWRFVRCYSELAADAANGSENPECSDELKRKARELLDEEIKTLEWQAKMLVSFNERKGACESTAAMIPSQDSMDRFVRYEVHLSREFDRILSQLERVQRMRRGQPGPPTLNVNVC
jgi:hypothetical protein